jgi:S1-C subfamily serine protease
MGVRSPNFVVGWSGACPGGSRDSVVVAGFSSRCVAGVALEELNPKLGEYFGTTEGVLVTDVDEESSLGLQPGDVILEIGDRDVTDPDRVRRILGTYDDDEAITLRIMRQKREMSVQGTLSR